MDSNLLFCLQSLVARAERTLPRERAPSRFGDGDETVAFSSLVSLLTERCDTLVLFASLTLAHAFVREIWER